MNRCTVIPKPLSDAELDAALGDDAILPSSGFTASVMAAVESESSVRAALPFPWKRALPALALAGAAALGVIALFIAAVITAFRHAARVAPSASRTAVSLDGRIDLHPLLHSSMTADIVWPLLALVCSGLCLLLCRRLIATH